MVKPIVYGTNLSPPVRAVLLTCEALGLNYEFKPVNLFAGEHVSEEFLKKNPQHTIPVLEDDGKFIWDSHAIVVYLVTKYGRDDKLCPKEPGVRARLDQRMHFDTGILFTSLRAITAPLLLNNDANIPQHKIDAILSGFDFLEKFLEDGKYLVGDTVTVADFCCVATVTSLEAFVEIDPVKYPNITTWKNRLSQLPFYVEANDKGAKGLVKMIHEKIEQLKK